MGMEIRQPTWLATLRRFAETPRSANLSQPRCSPLVEKSRVRDEDEFEYDYDWGPIARKEKPTKSR
jgi:hypothetical protein